MVLAGTGATAPAADAALLKSLRSPAPTLREAALDRLVDTTSPDPALLPELVRLLDDDDQAVAGKAAIAVSRYGMLAFAEIREVLAHGPAQQRWGAVVALYRMTADPAPLLPDLRGQLVRGDDLVARASLAVLARLGPVAAPALPEIRGLLEHEESELRWAALHALAAIGPPAQSALPDIEPLLEEASPELRLAAADAIRRLRPPEPLRAAEIETRIEWLRENVPLLMREHHVPGASLAIVQRGNLHWAEGFGVSDARGKKAVTIDTVFEAASMSKPILALGALQLIQQGRLDLDAPLVGYLGHDYLPDAPAHRLITARMALTHRTGLPNWRMGYDDMGGPLPLLFRPGSEYGYSGEGMLFLQRAMETITGEPLDVFAARRLFEPLGLTHTSYVWTEALEENLASGHRDDGSFENRTRYREANGAYSLYTPPTEYARLMLTLVTPGILGADALTPASIDLLLARELRVDDSNAYVRPGLARSVANYRALAWSIDVTAEGDIVMHSGSNSSGFRSFGQFNRDKGSALVIFTNGTGGSLIRDAVLARVGDL
jgi:CubicO group peptidase (beta-lactamase class C family)